MWLNFKKFFTFIFIQISKKTQSPEHYLFRWLVLRGVILAKHCRYQNSTGSTQLKNWLRQKNNYPDILERVNYWMIFILVFLAWRNLLYKSLGSKNLTLCKSNKNEVLLNFKKFWFKSYLIYITLEWFLWRCNFEPKAYALHTSFGTRFDFQNCCRIYQIRHKMFDTVGIHGHLYFG